ncbi:MAG: integrase family protein [Pseudonocardia sp.]|nr:integrase family protein [Pseudonocardia sp.]
MIAAMAFRLIYLMLVRVLSWLVLFTRQTPPRTSRSSCSATRSRSSGNAHRPSSPWADRALLSAVPSLGHLAPRMITNGAVDRAVHGWIADDCSRSTVKNSIAVLVRVMEQAVRDRGARTWPGKSRSRPSTDCGSPRPNMTSSFTRRG